MKERKTKENDFKIFSDINGSYEYKNARFFFRLLNILKNIDQSWWRCRGS